MSSLGGRHSHSSPTAPPDARASLDNPLGTPNLRSSPVPRHDELRTHPEPAVGFSDQSEGDASQISAYARLDFDNYTFFVQTLQVVLGRKSNDDDSSHHLVDVHLSNKKAISRRHAKIFYNFGTQRFEILIMGRNGAFVDDLFVEKGMTVPLVDGTKIQIGDIPFAFVLPSMELHDLDARKPGVAKPFNPSDALNLRTNLYQALLPDKKKAPFSAAARRNSKAEIVRRLSSARRRSHTSTNDEINALFKELESLEGADYDPDLLDAEVRELLDLHKSMTTEQIEHEEDEIDRLVSQHNLAQGVEEARDRKMDLSVLDREIASLAPLIGAQEYKAETGKAPRMGKPASIQPPPNRVYRQAGHHNSVGNNSLGSNNIGNLGNLGNLENMSAVGNLANAGNIGSLSNGLSALGYYGLGAFDPHTDSRPQPKLEVVVETIGENDTPSPAGSQTGSTKSSSTHRAISAPTASTLPPRYPPVCVFRSDAPTGTRKEPRKVARVHPLKEVPEQFRTKPNVSIPAMVLNVMRADPRKGLTLHDIHEAIKDLFPYYRYCPEGWQAGVTHHIRFSKMLVAAKNGHEADWLWTANDTYLAERESTRRKQQEVAMARAKESALKAQELHQKLRMDLRYVDAYSRVSTPDGRPGPAAEEFRESLAVGRAAALAGPTAPSSLASATVLSALTVLSTPRAVPLPLLRESRPGEGVSIKEQLAANRSRPGLSASPTPTSQGPARLNAASPAITTDTKKALAYLQKELFTLYKARKLSYNTAVTTEIITKALATTIAQVNTIGARAGCGDNALGFLVEKAPDQVSKILDIALTKSIREKEGMASKESTPGPETRNEVRATASPTPVSRTTPGLSKPTFGGPSRPAFSGPPKPAFSSGLSKPALFQTTKRDKRPGEDQSDPKKMVKLE